MNHDDEKLSGLEQDSTGGTGGGETAPPGETTPPPAETRPPGQTPPPEPPAPEPPVTEMAAPDKEARLWATFCHLGAIVGVLVPFANIVVPLVLWLIKREEMPFVDDQGKESLNFQISVTIAELVLLVLGLVFSVICIGVVFWVLMPILAIVALVFVVIASIKANEGQAYRYPLNWRLIK